MLVFVSIALALGYLSDVRAPIKFLVVALAIVPIARLIGSSTEHLSHYTGESIGGLLNATFGNLPELIITVVALTARAALRVSNAILLATLLRVIGGRGTRSADLGSSASHS